MDYARFYTWTLRGVGGFTGVVLLLSAVGANAVPRRLDCTLTRIETKVDSKSDFESEKRPISVVFDEQTKALTVYQNGNALVLNNVTTTVNSMSGYVDQVSLGINSADWNIVFQTYSSDSTRSEFGACSLSRQPSP
jgi:hypothetical protein